MPLEYSKLEAILKEKFPESEIKITDFAGDDDHWQIEIISNDFQGKSRIEQHKLVHARLKNTEAEHLHALGIKTSVY